VFVSRPHAARLGSVAAQIASQGLPCDRQRQRSGRYVAVAQEGSDWTRSHYKKEPLRAAPQVPHHWSHPSCVRRAG